jgi:hypothetical protein
MSKRQFPLDNVTTIKVTSADLMLLSKVLADIRSRFHVLSQSSILVNSETKCYFAYVNVKNSEVAEKLQEITPLGVDRT